MSKENLRITENTRVKDFKSSLLRWDKMDAPLLQHDETWLGGVVVATAANGQMVVGSIPAAATAASFKNLVTSRLIRNKTVSC